MIAGMRGIELAHHVFWSLEFPAEEIEIGCQNPTASDEYRAGSIAAYFQRKTGRSFHDIHSYFPMSHFVQFSKMYPDENDDELFEIITFEICKVEYKDDKDFLELLQI